MLLLALCFFISAFSTFSSEEMPVIDPLREDDHSDIDLYHIISLSRTTVDHDIDQLSQEQKDLWLDLHNTYRRNISGPFMPQASNVQIMEWNNTLAWAATEWLRYCQFKHGRAEIDNMTGWVLQGQNMYRGPSRDIYKPMWMFYIEYEWYYFNNLTCMQPYPKYKCGHVVGVLWALSSHIGAARRSYCFPQDSVIMDNVHYLPCGVIVTPGHIIYKYGWPCTRCPGGFLCAGTVCANERQCRAYNLDCSCKRPCHNCGTPDFKRCRCQCKTGFDWEDCSHPCMNAMDDKWKMLMCLRIGWRGRCEEEELFSDACHQFCGVCQSIVKTGKDTDAEDFCCDGKVCQPYYVLDPKTCECNLLCPSFICMFPPSTTTTSPTIKTTTTRTKNALKVSESHTLVSVRERPKKKLTLQDTAVGHTPSLVFLSLSLWMLCIFWIN